MRRSQTGRGKRKGDFLDARGGTFTIHVMPMQSSGAAGNSDGQYLFLALGIADNQ